MRKTLKFIASAVVALGLCGAVKAADFTHDFNTDPGAIFGGNARWVSGANGYVSLTDAINSQSGKMLLPDFDLGGPIEAFTATMKIRIDGSTCCGVGGTGPGGTIQPADGMSFNFANADDPAVANLADGAAGFVASAAEEGTTTGLSVCIDTWDNAGGEAPNIDIKANGVLVATARVAGNIFRNPEGTLTPRPILPLDPRTPDLNWAPLEISLSSCGGVTVKYKGVTVFDEVPTGITPRVGRFLMGGRTGGANDNHWVDDLAISTVTDSLAPVVSAKVPSTRFDVPPTTHISFTIQERLNPISMESIVLTLDGTAVTPTVTSTGDEGTRAIVVDYLPPTPLSAGADHTAVLEFADVFGLACQVKNLFTTGGGVMLFIEAEDYNYSDVAGVNPGQYAEFGAPDGSLRNKIGSPNIDYFDNTLANESADQYRPTDQLEAGKGPNNGGDSNKDRGGRTITADWVIGWTSANEWANYTRTFPNAAYRAFVRWGSGAGAGTPMNLILDEVTSDPALPSQTLRRIGTFNNPAPTGAWDGAFIYSPMLDGGGAPAAVRLSGKKTLRATVGNGAMDYNYIVFIPDPSVGVLRVTATPSPANNATSSSRDPLIRVVFTDRDTAVVPGTIRLEVNGTDVTGASTITPTATGAEITYQGTYAASAVVNAKVVWTDNDATPVTQELSWSFTTGLITPQSLFIEIEDFNYSDGEGVNPGQHIEFGAADGSLLNRDATQDIDSHDNDPGIPGDLGTGAYRPLSDVEAGKGPSSVGEQDRTRGSRTITADWVVGWTGTGEWLNYTRTFPTERYFVYARMASGNITTPPTPMAAELSIVTSDPTLPSQTTQKVGEFVHPRDTGGWDGTFIFVPMRDSSGAQASVKLSGKQTLRYGWLPGSHDAGYLLLVPGAPPVRSQVIAVTPPISRQWPNPYAPLVRATIVKEDTGASAVKLIIDGVDRTADATLDDTASSASISLQLPGEEGKRHTATVEWTDTLGTRSHTWNFRQGPLYSTENLFIELEDWNTGGGVYYPSAGGLDFNTKGLYMGQGGVHDVDFHESGNPEEDQYRNGEVPNIGIVPCCGQNLNDANNAGTGERPGFEVIRDYKMGWTDPGGDWYNYTRVFPAGIYHVWARISHGDASATMGGQLDLVTSDRTLPNQSLAMLGEFVAPASANWDGFTFVPMTDAAGEMVKVESPGGEFTVRYSVKRNGGDVNFLMLTPQITLSCPGNMTVGNDAGQCAAVVNFTATGAESCSPASGSSFPVGTTTVTCTAGSQTCSFTVTVEDREAPVVTVRAGANPGGKTKAKNGENNGFYQLLATDNCDTAPKIYIKDSASSFVAGPYSSGVDIKLNPNSGSNNVNKGGNGLAAHILIAGDAQIYATDSSGNVSAAVTVSK